MDRNSGANSVIDEDMNIGKGCLSNREDTSHGLKMTNDGDKTLFIMVMKAIKKHKEVIIYKLDILDK